MLLRRFDSEVVNLLHMANASNQSDNLAERDSSLDTAIRVTAVKEQQYGMCGRNKTSVNVGTVAPDDRLRLQ